MALGHKGYAPGDDARLRILLSIVELTHGARTASQRDICERAGITNGSLAHHLPLLKKDQLLDQIEGARGLRVTDAGFKRLLDAELIEPAGTSIVYGITPRGYEFLELPPATAPA